MIEHILHIQRCYQLADEAVAGGNHPFGALLVLDGQVIATAKNDAVISRNPTRHAEMVLLTTALPELPASPASVVTTQFVPTSVTLRIVPFKSAT